MIMSFAVCLNLELLNLNWQGFFLLPDTCNYWLFNDLLNCTFLKFVFFSTLVIENVGLAQCRPVICSDVFFSNRHLKELLATSFEP